MNELTFNLENIAAGHGYHLAVTGMAIVFVTLMLISLFIRGLPRALELAGHLFPSAEEAHSTVANPVPEDRPELIAAIGFAKHKGTQS